jgi:DNA repair exonuclease SbcCD ATPase subunit
MSKKHRIKIIQKIFGLSIALILITVLIRAYINRSVQGYMSINVQTKTVETDADFYFTSISSPSQLQDHTETIEDLRQHAEEIRTLMENPKLLEETEQSREDWEQICSLLDQELKAASAMKASLLSHAEKNRFHEEMAEFYASRDHECMKVVGDSEHGMTENIAYLKRYAMLTADRCDELLKA